MKCPKCGFRQEPSETCADCGIIFEKYHLAQQRKNQPPDTEALTDFDPEPQKEKKATGGIDFLNTLLHLHSTPWTPIPTPVAISMSALFAVLVYLIAANGVFVSADTSLVLYFLHETNLVFHEAGHVIFGIFGETIGILGGSLGQILIPMIVAGHFWARRDAPGFAFGLFWCFENFLDVAVYIADSRALLLPLIGGLGYEAHDWRNLLLDYGLLHKDTVIAGYVQNTGWAGIVMTWGWFTWKSFLGKKIPS